MKGQSSLTSRSFDMRVEMMTMFHHMVEEQQCAGETTLDKNTDRLDKLDKKDETWPTTLCQGVAEGYQGQSSPELRHFGLCIILVYFMSYFHSNVLLLSGCKCGCCFYVLMGCRTQLNLLLGMNEVPVCLPAWIESPACQWIHMLSVGSVASTFKGNVISEWGCLVPTCSGHQQCPEKPEIPVLSINTSRSCVP